ncbi:MAG: DUF2852 domain-containing protein [Mesorhizobium sp.]|nr:DUF2852 domain-containing protein [Mesorhizobium sp.]RWF68621.1 MAG: DUF2852 domain-containing protein [Mesorhizobium sp.]
MNTSALIRPAWTPATIALMVIGFMVFWPLGFAMLAYIIWGDRLEGFKRDVNRATDGIFAGCLERLAEERRKLDEMLNEFDEYARELRRAKDQEEFDRFMAERNKRTAPTTTSGPTGATGPKRGKGSNLLDD